MQTKVIKEILQRYYENEVKVKTVELTVDPSAKLRIVYAVEGAQQSITVTIKKDGPHFQSGGPLNVFLITDITNFCENFIKEELK